MPRRGSRSRDLIASELLLEQEQSRSQLGGPSRARKSRPSFRSKGNSRIPGFQLRDEDQPLCSTARPDELEALSAAFGDVFPRQILADVLAAASGDVDRAASELLAMSAADCSNEVPSALSAVEDKSLWSLLPSELKHMVLRHLTVKDRARAARVNREFAEAQRVACTRASRLVLAADLSSAAVQGAVAAYRNATSVVLRCQSQVPRFGDDWERLAHALERGENSRCPRLSIKELSVLDSHTLDGDAVSALCLSLQHLRSLHFRRSGPVDPGTLRTLANYKRASESPRALDEEDGDRGPLVSNHPGVNAGEPTHRVYPDSLTTRGHRARGFTDWEAQVAVVQTRRLSVTGDMRGLECLTLSDVPASERGLGSLWARGAATRSSLRRLVFLGTTVDLHQLCAGAAAVPGEVGSCGLEELKLVDCRSTSSEVRVLPRTLANLTLTGVKGISALSSTSTPALETVVVSTCSINTLELQARALRRLDIGPGCRELRVLQVVAPRLQQLTLMGCSSLAVHHVRSVLDHANTLRALTLVGNQVLIELQLPKQVSASLEALDVSGCYELQRITFWSGSGSLKSIRAVHCTSLERISIPSRVLRHINLQNCPQLKLVELMEDRGDNPILGGNSSPPRSTKESSHDKPYTNLLGCPLLPAASKDAIRKAVGKAL